MEQHAAHSRPLGQVSLVRDPPLVIRADGVVDVWAPRHVGKHFEQILNFLRRQRAVSVLQDPKKVKPCHLEYPWI